MSLPSKISNMELATFHPPPKGQNNEELAGSEDLREESEVNGGLTHLINSTEDSDFTVTDSFNNVNSRENGHDVDSITMEEAKENAAFKVDELISRQSVLIYTKEKTSDKVLSLDSFKILTVLGKGTFGKVYLTELIENKKLYAIKAIRKDVLLETEQIESTKLERDILLE